MSVPATFQFLLSSLTPCSFFWAYVQTAILQCLGATGHRGLTPPARRLLCCLCCLCVVLLVGGPISAQGLSPAEVESRLRVPEGLKATLFASEPMVRQPNFVKCDPRGRLWTIQYLQYPNPAGLKRVSVDRWSRTTYDRVPRAAAAWPSGR